jgi:hypothetical protein
MGDCGPRPRRPWRPITLNDPGGRASLPVYCASVSQNVRCVSTIVRPIVASVSVNVRRKGRSMDTAIPCGGQRKGTPLRSRNRPAATPPRIGPSFRRQRRTCCHEPRNRLPPLATAPFERGY